jgi:hypothetical protein
LAGETGILGEILPQGRFVHHKSRITWTVIEPGANAVGSRRLTAWDVAQRLAFYLSVTIDLQVRNSFSWVDHKHTYTLCMKCVSNYKYGDYVILWAYINQIECRQICTYIISSSRAVFS